MKNNKKALIITTCSILALILFLVSTFFIITAIGKHQFHKDDVNISANTIGIDNENTITYNGKKYTLNKNIVSVLVMGIDRENVDKNLGNGKNGQADVIFVATIDTKSKKTCIIPISRETMVDIDIYSTDGKFAERKREQLCLAYAYGDTAENCSKNVMESVKRLLCGININSYVTMELTGIEKITDMVGGIELTSLDDMVVSPDLSFYKGQKTKLNGKMARCYIQHRDNDLEANTRRMQRQKQYLSALMSKTGNAVLTDFSNLSKFYNTLSPYFLTNVSFAQITYLAQNCLTVNLGDTLDYKTIDGTLTQSDKWIEFEADKYSVLQTVIDVFYIPAD